MSCQRILAQSNNLVPSATVSASSVLPAARQIFQQRTTRSGNGTVVLSGDYAGDADATFEIEITAPATGAEIATEPVFAGAGNGTLEDIHIDPGTPAQDITLTLKDLGTETSAAQLTIYGDILLRAKSAGSAGNALSLIVTPHLTLSASAIGALSSALTKSTQEWDDQRGDFGAVPLMPDGSIPANAPRIVFGGDLSRVYRHYKRWDGEQWQYGVSPKLAADYTEGSTVHAVIGDYEVTVKGTTTETYSGITSLYSLTDALVASTLVEVVGAVGNDGKPNGIAGIDLPIRTAAFALPITASDPERMPGLVEVSVSATSPTETVTLECTKNTPVGAETWAVRSKAASTALADAVTGVLYEGDTLEFKVPKIPMTVSPISGGISITSTNFPRTDAKAGVPAICLYKPTLGAKAASKTLTLVWTARPADDCDCLDGKVIGGPSAKCLGIDIEGDEAMGDLAAGHQSRLEALYLWRKNFIVSNTDLNDDTGDVRGIANDLDLADQITTEFRTCLDDMYDDSDTPGSDALAAWDDDLAAVNTDLAALEGIATPTTEPTELIVGTVISAASTTVFCPPSTQKNGHKYTVTLTDVPVTNDEGFTDYREQYNFTLSEDVPDWPTNGSSVIVNGTGLIDNVLATGTYLIAATARVIDAGVYEGTTAVDISSSSGTRYSIDQFVRRYSAKMDYIRAMAGISPKSEANNQGDGCWQDPGDSFWWAIHGTDYLPVFNNVYYHSTTLQDNSCGGRVPMSTGEFGFGLRVGCPERLKEGDSVTISINDVSANYPYQIGDSYQIPVVGGGPLVFTGGVDGTDTLTWSVVSSTAGALADYALNADEDAYSGGGLNFELHRGGIDFALDDRFTFSVEAGGRFRWRKDANAWSADIAIAEDVELDDGLTVRFRSGTAPSFVEGDVYRYAVRQPHAPNHTQSAHGETWKWSGAAATLTLEWDSDQTIKVVGLLRHGLAAPATISIALKNGVDATLQTLTPVVSAGPILAVLPEALTTVRYLEITVVNAGSMSLGWVYAGVPFEPSANARMQWQRAYALDRSGGLNPRGAYLGSGRSGEMTWEDFLSQASADELLNLIDHCKTDGDAPIVVIPQVLFPQDAVLARIDSDALDISDYFEFQPKARTRRHLSLTLPLSAVYG